MKPALVDGNVVAEVQCGDNTTVLFKAENVRRAKTGVHAKVKIGIQNHGKITPLASDNFNTERDRERTRLVNSAWKKMPSAFTASGVYPKKDLDEDLEAFCEAIWTTHTGQFSAVLAAGNPDYTTEWYCPPLVMKGGGTIIFAAGGGGKSFTCLTAAVAINSGISNIWDPMMSAPVMYINVERSKDSMEGRLARVNRAMGLSAYEPLLMVPARGKSIDMIYDAAQRDIKRHGVEVVVLDSISASGSGDLNENMGANALMDMLDALSPTWLAVAHSPDTNAEKVFGSVMFTNRADLVVRLRSQELEDKLGVSLSITKANDTRRGQDHYIAYCFNGTGLERIEPGNIAEFPELSDAKPPSRYEQIRAFIEDEGPSSASDIAAGLKMDRSNVQRELRKSGFARGGRRGRTQLYELYVPPEGY